MENVAIDQYLGEKSDKNKKTAQAAGDVVAEQLKLRQFCDSSDHTSDRSKLDERLSSLVQLIVRFQEVYLK